MRPKIILPLALFIAILGIPSDCFSSESYLLFSVTTKNIARIGVINRGKNSLSLNISDKQGVSVFTEVVKSGGSYFKLLDLTKLPEGNYKVTLTGNGEEFTKTFTITEGKVKINKAIEEVPPKFYVLNKEALIVYYQNTHEEDVKISFEANKNIVFEDKDLKGSPIKRTYSLKDLPKGNYTVFLYAEKKIYTYSLELP